MKGSVLMFFYSKLAQQLQNVLGNKLLKYHPLYCCYYMANCKGNYILGLYIIRMQRCISQRSELVLDVLLSHLKDDILQFKGMHPLLHTNITMDPNMVHYILYILQ